MDMVDQRNLCLHIDNKPVAETLVGSIVKTFHPAFVHLQADMQSRIEPSS